VIGHKPKPIVPLSCFFLFNNHLVSRLQRFSQLHFFLFLLFCLTFGLAAFDREMAQLEFITGIHKILIIKPNARKLRCFDIVEMSLSSESTI